VTLLQNVVEIARPDAPYDLTDEEADFWRVVVNRMEPDYFPAETWPILCAYCRATVRGRHLSGMRQTMEKMEKFDLDAYAKIVRMENECAKTVAMLATKMRIAHQSTYDVQKRKPPVLVKPPWEK
jgi:hypothetical protein